jgi:transposase
VDSETGELSERRLAHREEAEQFYRKLNEQGLKARVGMEASGHSRWFERLLGELQFELWIGDAAEIRTKRVRKQKTDRQDAQLLLRLMMEDRFPQEGRDNAQLFAQPRTLRIRHADSLNFSTAKSISPLRSLSHSAFDSELFS